jgi:IclR family acetate operon transcriptional repressor
MGRAVERVLDVFVAFSEERRPLSVSELARRLNIPNSTCHGLVKDLEAAGYVVEVRRGHGYYPTSRLASIAGDVSLFDPLSEILVPQLTQLKDTIDETVFLAKRVRQKLNYLMVLESPHSLRFVVNVGAPQPLHATAMGKALLGSMDRPSREKLLDSLVLERFTDTTITSRQKLSEEIDLSLRRGWFASMDEHQEGVVGVAIAIAFDREGYGVAVGGPSVRMQQKLDLIVEAFNEFKTNFNAGAP